MHSCTYTSSSSRQLKGPYHSFLINYSVHLFAFYWQRESHDAGDGIVDAVLTVAVTSDEAVVADESLGEATSCLMSTFGSGLRIRRSCSFTSSSAMASTFSPLVRSESLRPRNSTDSTFRCASIAPASAPLLLVAWTRT